MLCFSHSHVKLERKGVLFLPRAIKMKCQGDKGRRSQWASHIILGLRQSWKAHFGIQFFLCSYVFEFSATLLNYSLNWEGILATCSVYKLCSFCCFTLSRCLLFHFLDGFSWTFVDVLANPNAVSFWLLYSSFCGEGQISFIHYCHYRCLKLGLGCHCKLPW